MEYSWKNKLNRLNKTTMENNYKRKKKFFTPIYWDVISELLFFDSKMQNVENISKIVIVGGSFIFVSVTNKPFTQ